MSDFVHIPDERRYNYFIKNKRNPESYQAILLCFTVLKLYEKCILTFINRENTVKVNPMQGGFQKHFSINDILSTPRKYIFHKRK
jgi:hypothetical protein